MHFLFVFTLLFFYCFAVTLLGRPHGCGFRNKRWFLSFNPQVPPVTPSQGNSKRQKNISPLNDVIFFCHFAKALRAVIQEFTSFFFLSFYPPISTRNVFPRR